MFECRCVSSDTSSPVLQYVPYWMELGDTQSYFELVSNLLQTKGIIVLLFLQQIFVSDYGINSILYQRGIYPPETFTRTQKYGLTLLMSTDESIKNYLEEVISQIKGLDFTYLMT